MTLILKPKNESDYRLFIELAKRLQVSYQEQNNQLEEESATAENEFMALAGTWQGEQSTDELIHLIESARTSKKIDISL